MIRAGHVAAGFVALAVALASWTAGAQDLGTIKVGVLEFGTVNWELDVIKHHGLDRQRHFTLEVQGFGSGEATNVALQGEAVDAIVDDYFWVSRQRSDGQMLTFVPFSEHGRRAHGAARLGHREPGRPQGQEARRRRRAARQELALLQGLAAKRHGMDLAAEVEPVYGAPPLLNEKVQDGELDAVLNYWHFAARLDAKGFKQLVGIEDAIGELGATSVPPQLGFVFYQSFVDQNPELVAAFADASRAAKELLQGDAEWERIRPLTKAEDDATFEALKRRYRAGIIEHWGAAEQADAAKVYAMLAGLGGEKLVGAATELAPGTFWPGVTY